jgi:hypothetical protein
MGLMVTSGLLVILGCMAMVAATSIAAGQQEIRDVGTQMTNSNINGSMSRPAPGSMVVMGPLSGLSNNTSNITSTIGLFDTITDALESKVNVSLSDAAASASASIGNNSHVVAAHLGDENGYLLYNILALDSDRNFNRILVDPGNGDIIFTETISKEQLMNQGMARHHIAAPPDTIMMMPRSMAPGVMGGHDMVPSIPP